MNKTKTTEQLADEWLNRRKGDCAMYKDERACLISFLNHVRETVPQVEHAHSETLVHTFVHPDDELRDPRIEDDSWIEPTDMGAQ